MEYRHGVCSDCGAEYKLPVTFQANRAKCKECGGAVEVGPVQTAAPKAPAAKPMPTRSAPPAAKKKKKPEGGLSMKERLLAERAASEKSGGSSAKAKPAARTKAESAKEKPAAAKAGAGQSSAGSGSRSAAKRAGGGRKRRGEDEGDEEEGGRRGRGRAAKKKNPAPIIGGVVLLLVASYGGYKMMSGDDVEAGASDENVASAEGEGTEGEALAAVETDDATAAGAESTTPGDAGTETDNEGEAGEAETSGDGEQGAGDEASAEEASAPKPEKVYDPSSVDLSVFGTFDMADGTTEDEWIELTDLARTMVDPLAGAAGNRAIGSLKKTPRKAFPAMLNVMLKLDFQTEQGYRDGDIIQRAFMEMCSGKNFGWRFTIEAEDALFNKKIARNWANQWVRCIEEPTYWDALSKKLNQKASKKPEEEEGAIDVGDDLDF